MLAYTDESYTSGGTPSHTIVHEVYRMVNGKIRSIYAYVQQPSALDQPIEGDTESYAYSGSWEVTDNGYLSIVEGFLDALVGRDFDKAVSYLADSVVFITPDGYHTNTVKDSLMVMVRDHFENNDIYIAYVAGVEVHSTDKNEDWVLLWTDETLVNQEGVKEESSFHDAYRIENNKIRVLRIFIQQKAQQ